MSITANAEGPQDDESEQALQLWIDRSSSPKIRTEFAAGSEVVTAVIDGATWWSWSPSRGGMTNGGDSHSTHGLGPGYPLTDPASIASLLNFEVLDRTRFIGRSALRVHATPKAKPNPNFGMAVGLHDLGLGADGYELSVDEERGILLRSEARRGGLPFLVLEMDEVAFDDPIDPEAFRIPLPPGEHFESTQAWRDRLRKGHSPDEDDPS